MTDTRDRATTVRTRQALGACSVAVLAAFALAACAGGGNGDESAAPTTAATTTTATTTETPTEPEPITAAERRWAATATRYIPRVDREVFRPSSVVTNASLRAEIKILEACTPTLRRAGAPGRFARPAQTVRRACRRFETAARNLRRVAAIGLPVLAGTDEDRITTRAMNAAAEAEGNGFNLLMVAKDQIAATKAKLPK